MSDFDLRRIREPELLFANGETAKDPRGGLLKHGPRPRANTEEEVVNVGIVGDSRSISMMEELLRKMRTGISSNSNRKRWRQPFPGLGVDSQLQFDYQTHEKWKGRIRQKDIDTIAEIPNRQERVQPAIRHLKHQIAGLGAQTPPPDITFVAIPERFVELCADPNTDTDRIQTKNSDFRSQIKLAGMEAGTPTQLMSPKALRGGSDVQHRSEFAWNIAVGMLYKAREGRPWKTASFDSQQCYAGISFYRERGADPDVRASIAQVFIEGGENFVIRGDPVQDIASDEAQTHLSYADAKRLVESILEKYGNYRDSQPNRLVLHKSSNFWPEESEGFNDGAADVNVKEFVTIRKHHPLRLFPEGDNPPLRGTLALPPDRSEGYLYTTGYVPEQSVYNGPGVPTPIVVKPHEEYFSGDYRRICREILTFTKLDWNSSDFCKRLPVTIGIANAVSDILAEPNADDINLQTHYYYYM
ncbi:argonaute/piwi family protein [Halorubrum tebenquichense]|uniref:Piwi domain-containing protein n=1 Tax=Halorubrum tebenquichense DSM 14210 TaxID=1227485 RepID=M0DFB9_9EURY|nr:hypothetical protein [Halorubrum tebenquichense]ELZ32864.1 hypothetical protein C472_15304 [Halorubrum tebenquichense DSM 14210]